MWHLQCYTNELVYKTDSQTQKADLLLPRGKGGGGTNREIGMSRCKLFYTGWMDNELLLYYTGHYIQSAGINYNGKEYA